jgi:hypothetical protein
MASAAAPGIRQMPAALAIQMLTAAQMAVTKMFIPLHFADIDFKKINSNIRNII